MSTFDNIKDRLTDEISALYDTLSANGKSLSLAEREELEYEIRMTEVKLDRVNNWIKIRDNLKPSICDAEVRKF